METMKEAKTLRLHKTSADDAFFELVCSTVFLRYVLKHTSLHTLFSYSFCARRLYSTAKTKGKRDLPLLLSFSHPSLTLPLSLYIYVCVYIRNKSHLDFFSRAISLTAKVYSKVIHGVREARKEKKN